jgi:hypothetical protein
MESNMAGQEIKGNQSWVHKLIRCLKLISLVFSIGLLIFLASAYFSQADSLAAVTFFPAWFWLVPGLILAGAGFRCKNKKYGLMVCGLWVLFLFTFAGEFRSCLSCWKRWPVKKWVEERREERAIRVVSLNCAGKPLAMEEVEAYDPDIVLLQESPGRKTIEAFAKKLFGETAGVMWDIDTSILARGNIFPKSIIGERRRSGIWAEIKLANEFRVEVFSIRFIPPIVRMDLWSPECWRVQAENRQFRSRQVGLIVEKLKTIPVSIPVIVGGDFNAPAEDGATRDLQSRLEDTFHRGGVGWGNTGINEIPVVRVDQVWASDHFIPVAVVARKTLHSDHRMVICDLLIRSVSTTKPFFSDKAK